MHGCDLAVIFNLNKVIYVKSALHPERKYPRCSMSLGISNSHASCRPFARFLLPLLLGLSVSDLRQEWGYLHSDPKGHYHPTLNGLHSSIYSNEWFPCFWSLLGRLGTRTNSLLGENIPQWN